jgi:hypothetical protein
VENKTHMQKATPKQYHSTTGEAHKKGEKKPFKRGEETLKEITRFAFPILQP